MLTLLTQSNLAQEVMCAVPPAPIENSITDCANHVSLIQPEYFSPSSPCYHIYELALNKKEACQLKFLTQSQENTSNTNATTPPTQTPVVIIQTPTPTANTYRSNTSVKAAATISPTPEITSSPQPTPIMTEEVIPTSTPTATGERSNNNLLVFITAIASSLVTLLVVLGLAFKTGLIKR